MLLTSWVSYKLFGLWGGDEKVLGKMAWLKKWMVLAVDFYTTQLQILNLGVYLGSLPAHDET